MINNELKNYLEKEYSKENNYKKILSKEGRVINMKRKILNIAAIFLIVTVVGAVSTTIYAKIQWNIEFKEYKNAPSVETKGVLDEIKEDGYAEVVDMDYITQDGISIKINSILLTDDCLDTDLTFKFDKDVEVSSQMFSFGYVIYDENHNIYGIHERMHIGENSKNDNLIFYIYKELGVKYDKKDVFAVQLNDREGITNVDINEEDRTIDMNINIRAKDKFPQSKKLYIRIFDPGFTMIEENDRETLESTEDFKLSNAKWNFEIEVPDKFYERNTIELKPENSIPGIEFKRITISETGMSIEFKSQEYDGLIKQGKDMETEEFTNKLNELLNITDSDGNKYKELSSKSTEEEERYKISIDAGLQDLDKKIYINYKNDGVQYKEKLIEK